MAERPETTVRSRQARRRARARRRVTALAVALVVVGAGATAAWLLSRDEGQAEVAASTTTTTTATTAAPPAFQPAITATTGVGEITAFDAPADGAGVVATLEEYTEYAVRRTFLVIDRQPGWLQVLLPMRPNQATGWIRESDVTLGETDYEIVVELSTTTVTLFKAGELVLETASGIGTEETPTPPGQYYVTDPVDLTSEPNGAYGAYALGISGYSEVLLEFNGGPGQIAIHGTTNPADLGQRVSNGCVRVLNETILEIANQVPVGTPFTVVA